MKERTAVEKQWIFTRSQLDQTPSREDGIILEEELNRRKRAIEYIRTLGVRAGLVDQYGIPAQRGLMPSAAILIHRFYMRRSLKDFSEQLIAPTILFLASKLTEEALKLRHIVNACLAEWEPTAIPWLPNAQDQYPAQSLEYRRWEKEILTTEELALEALCFDMAIEHPWVHLFRSIKGLDASLEDGDFVESSKDVEMREEINGHANGKGKAKSRLTENVVKELGWVIINAASQSPIIITAYPDVLAFTTFAVIISLLDQIPISHGVAAAAELGDKFGLAITFDPDKGATGSDKVHVEACLNEFNEFSNLDLIDKNLFPMIPQDAQSIPYTRRLQKASAHASAALNEGRELDAMKDVGSQSIAA